MAYSTVTDVRKASGFVGNSNISDLTIENYITRADSKINSYISDAYTLPLGVYYRNSLLFAGTGTGAGTLTITINGTDYDISVSTGMTAQEAADAFRSAASGSSDFVVNSLGSSTQVVLYSVDAGVVADVQITSTDPQTVAGITATGGTVEQVAPPYVEAISIQIASAYLLIEEYGAEAQGTDKDGYKRMQLWESVLKKIAKKQEKLFDYASVELPASASQTISFYPTRASDTQSSNPTSSFFKKNQLF